MMDMLMDCAIFYPLQGDLGNYYQLSGPPISDLNLDQVPKEALPDTILAKLASRQPSSLTSEDRTPCKIAFVRSRMFYAKAALNAKGGIRFGMRHIRRCTLRNEIAILANLTYRRFEPLLEAR